MGTTYAEAGVDQDRKDSAIDVMLRMMRKTYDPGVMEIPWGFAGLYSLKSSPSSSIPDRFSYPVLKIIKSINISSDVNVYVT